MMISDAIDNKAKRDIEGHSRTALLARRLRKRKAVWKVGSEDCCLYIMGKDD